VFDDSVHKTTLPGALEDSSLPIFPPTELLSGDVPKYEDMTP